MKAFGIKIFEMVRDLKDTLMEIHTSANLNMEKLMVKVSIHGKMVRSTMVNGTRESNKATEYGKAFKVILT